MSEKQPVSKWNNPAFLHSLMLALYDQLKGSLSKEVKDAVEQKMHRDGFEDITWDAIRQHIQKLQRKEQTSGDSGEASITPVKKGAKKAATPRKRKTPVKKAKNESDAEEEEEQATPPPKKPCTPKKPSMKEEADEFLNTEAMDGNRFETNDVEI